uniref:Uncharacterized protein n=1 Tax=Rhizophora mucronata TaxID=61149 RepID=A0A2P2N1V6_RHIMU
MLIVWMNGYVLLQEFMLIYFSLCGICLLIQNADVSKISCKFLYTCLTT